MISKFYSMGVAACMALFAVSIAGQGSATAVSGSDKDLRAENKAPSAAVPGSQDERYRIGFRDKLSVQVFRHADLNQTVTVNPNGTIKLFKIDDPLVAVCKTERELADEIAAAYRKDYLRNPEVNVVAVEQMSHAVFVMGAVVKPGPQYLRRKVHLLELLALAEGPSKEAGSRLYVARTGSRSDCGSKVSADPEDADLYTFSIRNLQEGKESFFIQPGDIVSVLEADVVYVYGNVVEQGQVVMKQPLTLTQAIASAKGLRPATKKDKVRIIRQKPGTTDREELVFDLNAIDKQKVNDPFLQPNDIVALSEDRARSILNSVAKSFTQGIGTLVYRPY